MLETRFTVVLSADTDDEAEALEGAREFIRASKEGWYSGVRLDSEIEVVKRPDGD